MADFYDEMAAVATELLTEFKQGEAILVRATAAGAPPNEYTPGTPGVPQEFTLNAIGGSVSVDDRTAKLIADGTITQTDIVLTCDASVVTPNIETDRVRVDGVVKVIKAILQVPAIGTPVIWKLFVAS